MKYSMLFVLALAIISGCAVNPRYRSGESRTVADEKNNRNADAVYQKNREGYMSATSAELIELGRIIQSFLGKPYGASSEDGNLDCSRFTMLVFDKFNNTKLPRTSDKQSRTGQKIKKGDLRYGDLVFYRTDGNSISHVGIYIGFDEFIHATNSSGIIITHMDEAYWKKRFAGARRVLP